MPLRNVATTFTIEQQRLEINSLAADVNNIAIGVTSVGTAATANALAAGATGADLTLSGTLTVNGSQTILNTATLEVEDKNIVIAKGSTTDAAASGGGITLKGADDKTISYNQTGDQWEFNKTLSSNSDGTTARELKLVSGSTWGIRSNPTTGTNSYGFEIYKGGAGTDIKLGFDSNGNATLAGDISLSEGKKTIFGSDSGNGAYMKHQSGHLEFKNETGWIYWDTVADIRIRTGASYGTALTVHSDQSCTFGGKIRFDTDNYIECNNIADTMEFTLGGVLVGEFGTNSLKLLDTFRLKLGTGNDLQLYHDNNSSLNLITAANNQELKISDLKTSFYDYTGVTKYAEIRSDGVFDSKGNLRTVPTSPLSGTHAGGYVMLASDVGKCVAMSGDVTLQSASSGGPFGGGDVITILNASGSAITINEGSNLDLYNSGTGNTGNCSLGARGMATVIYMYGGNTAYISGAQLT